MKQGWAKMGGWSNVVRGVADDGKGAESVGGIHLALFRFTSHHPHPHSPFPLPHTLHPRPRIAHIMAASAYNNRVSVASQFVSQNTVVTNNAVTRIEDNKHITRVLTDASEVQNNVTTIRNGAKVGPDHTICATGDVAVLIMDENDRPIHDATRGSTTFDAPLPLLTTCVGGLQHYVNFRTLGVIRAGPGIGGTGRIAVSLAVGGAMSITNTGRWTVGNHERVHAVMPKPIVARGNTPDGQTTGNWDGLARPMIISRDTLFREALAVPVAQVFLARDGAPQGRNVIPAGARAAAQHYIAMETPVYVAIWALVEAPNMSHAIALLEYLRLSRFSLVVTSPLTRYLTAAGHGGVPDDTRIFFLARDIQKNYLERTFVGTALERKGPGEPLLVRIDRA